MFGVYEDLVFSVAKRVPRRIISSFAELNAGMAPSVALWCVPPRKRLAAALGTSFTPRPHAGSASYTRTAIVMQWPHFRRSSRPMYN